jgi:hypothetical protein
VGGTIGLVRENGSSVTIDAKQLLIPAAECG